jgi:REP element-mobilizing transposase RayT
MPTHRQSLQTYALTVVTDQRRRILQTDRNANHVIATLFRHRNAGRFQLHGFVIMPDHIHALITPAIDHATSRCVQLIKGGSSFLIGKPTTGKIWQDGYHEHRIRDATRLLLSTSIHRQQSQSQELHHLSAHSYHASILESSGRAAKLSVFSPCRRFTLSLRLTALSHATTKSFLHQYAILCRPHFSGAIE